MVSSLPGARGSTGLGPAAATARAMRVGQHVIALALTAIGVARAVGDGTEPAAAIVAGLAVLAWHTAGALLPAHAPHRATVWWLVGFAAVWGAAVAVSAEFVWLAFLLWLLAGHLLRWWWAFGFSVLVYAIVAVAPVLHHGDTSYANIFGPLIGGVFALGISRGYLQLLREAAEREALVDSLQLARHETELLQDELALAQRQSGAMGERARIARDIHDTVAQGLSSIRLIAHAATDSSAPSSALERIELIASESLGDVRRIIAALTPAELEAGALESALGRLIDRFVDEAATGGQSRAGVSTVVDGQNGQVPLAHLHVDEALPHLPSNVEVALLRVGQSALSNVRQHAGASRVDVTLSAAGGGVRLDVRDDGVGFDASHWDTSDALAGNTASFGLRLMRERLRDLGGGLDVESAPGEGCAISAYLPLGPSTTPRLSDDQTQGETA